LRLFKRFKSRRYLKPLLRIGIAVGVVLASAWLFLAQPSFSKSGRSEQAFDHDRLRGHVRVLSVDYFPRNHSQRENLQRSADYISGHFEKAGATVTRQKYFVGRHSYQNVIARFGNPDESRLIIGAHYDSHGVTPGADDNASGVAGLIELAYLMGEHSPDVALELVAYTLEEPPFFLSRNMGSRIHAASVEHEKQRIRGVLVLEMIGYFSDDWGSQNYPLPLLKIFYPSRGNFATVVGNLSQRRFTKDVKIHMKGSTDLPVYSINAPERLPGINFSDHASYWQYGIDAVMVTDTAFYRNLEYHSENDVYERLDYRKMHDTVISVYEAATGLLREPMGGHRASD
jgi:hypothetical protein